MNQLVTRVAEAWQQLSGHLNYINNHHHEQFQGNPGMPPKHSLSAAFHSETTPQLIWIARKRPIVTR